MRNFSTKRSNGNFNLLPPDQVIEQTINKDQKGKGGIIGISTSVGSVQRWVLTSHTIAAITSDFKSSLGLDILQSTPKDLQEKRKIFDENYVKSCYETISLWNNPFQKSESIASLSSGINANKKVENDLLRAEHEGKMRLKEFAASRIECNDIGFHDPIKKLKLFTFESLMQTSVVKVKGIEVAIRSDRKTFARMLIIRGERDISLQKVLEYELSSLPLSIANPDGSLCKSDKSKLFTSLESFIPTVDIIPPNCPFVYDGMVLLQKLPPTLSTFADISNYLLKKIMNGSSRVAFFVTDHYLPNSVKSSERSRRANIGSLRITVTRGEQRIPKQFTKFLRNADNKIELIKFLVHDWSSNRKNQPILENKVHYVTYTDKAYSISSTNNILKLNPVLEFQSSQEEADTKMFLCASFAADLGFSSVNIVTVDSDVAILSLYYQTKLDISLYLELGTGSRVRIFNISSKSIDGQITNVLPSLHAISGCDSTSCFSGIGKSKWLKVLQSDDRFIDALSLLGEEEELRSVAAEVLEEYVCVIYGLKNESNVNKARYKLFSSKKKLPEPQKLPPTKDALLLHFNRANYQAYEWKRALDLTHVFLEPIGKGWILENGELKIDWMKQKPAPDSILEFVSCKCSKSMCKSGLCQCFKMSLRCTDACNCNNCENIVNEDEEDVDTDESDDSETDESESEN